MSDRQIEIVDFVRSNGGCIEGWARRDEETTMATMTTRMVMRMSDRQIEIVDFVRSNPGCSTADVYRSVSGWLPGVERFHRRVYDSARRLIRRGILRTGPVREESRRGGAGGLYAV